jgi:hypothetical protein
MARRKWRIVYPGSSEVDQLTSERATYDFIDELRSAWAAGEADGGKLTVQVDEGHGWETYEHINFAEEQQ